MLLVPEKRRETFKRSLQSYWYRCTRCGEINTAYTYEESSEALERCNSCGESHTIKFAFIENQEHYND